VQLFLVLFLYLLFKIVWWCFYVGQRSYLPHRVRFLILSHPRHRKVVIGCLGGIYLCTPHLTSVSLASPSLITASRTSSHHPSLTNQGSSQKKKKNLYSTTCTQKPDRAVNKLLRDLSGSLPPKFPPAIFPLQCEVDARSIGAPLQTFHSTYLFIKLYNLNSIEFTSN